VVRVCCRLRAAGATDLLYAAAHARQLGLLLLRKLRRDGRDDVVDELLHLRSVRRGQQRGAAA
jgi:hypothetical protein